MRQRVPECLCVCALCVSPCTASCSTVGHVLCECSGGLRITASDFDAHRAQQCCVRTLAARLSAPHGGDHQHINSTQKAAPGLARPSHGLVLASTPYSHPKVLERAEANDATALHQFQQRIISRSIRERFGRAALQRARSSPLWASHGLVGVMLARTAAARRARFWAAAARGDAHMLTHSEARTESGPLPLERLHQPRRDELAQLLVARFVQVAVGSSVPLLRDPPPPLTTGWAQHFWASWQCKTRPSATGRSPPRDAQSASWARLERANCYRGHGGAELADTPFITIPRQHLASDGGASACIRACQKRRGCFAVVVSSNQGKGMETAAEGSGASQDGAECHFRANVFAARCTRDSRFNTHFDSDYHAQYRRSLPHESETARRIRLARGSQDVCEAQRLVWLAAASAAIGGNHSELVGLDPAFLAEALLDELNGTIPLPVLETMRV